MRREDLTEEQREDIMTSIAREVAREFDMWNGDSEHPVISRHQQLLDLRADRGDALRAQLE